MPKTIVVRPPNKIKNGDIAKVVSKKIINVTSLCVILAITLVGVEPLEKVNPHKMKAGIA
jgi:hypothetical protein